MLNELKADKTCADIACLAKRVVLSKIINARQTTTYICQKGAISLTVPPLALYAAIFSAICYNACPKPLFTLRLLL